MALILLDALSLAGVAIVLIAVSRISADSIRILQDNIRLEGLIARADALMADAYHEPDPGARAPEILDIPAHHSPHEAWLPLTEADAERWDRAVTNGRVRLSGQEL